MWRMWRIKSLPGSADNNLSNPFHEVFDMLLHCCSCLTSLSCNVIDVASRLARPVTECQQCTQSCTYASCCNEHIPSHFVSIIQHAVSLRYESGSRYDIMVNPGRFHLLAKKTYRLEKLPFPPDLSRHYFSASFPAYDKNLPPILCIFGHKMMHKNIPVKSYVHSTTGNISADISSQRAYPGLGLVDQVPACLVQADLQGRGQGRICLHGEALQRSWSKVRIEVRIAEVRVRWGITLMQIAVCCPENCNSCAGFASITCLICMPELNRWRKTYAHS